MDSEPGGSPPPETSRRGRVASLVGICSVAALCAAATAAAALATRPGSFDAGSSGAWLAATLLGTLLTTGLVAAAYVVGKMTVPAPPPPAPEPEPDTGSLRSHIVAIVESFPSAVVLVEPTEDDARILLANRRAAALAGCQPEDLSGADFRAFVRDPGVARALIASTDDPEGEAKLRTGHLASAARDEGEVRLACSRIGDPGGEFRPTYLVVATSVEEMRRDERRRLATYRLSELSQAAETPTELLRGVCTVLGGAMRVDAFHVAVVDTETGRLTVAYASDPRSPGVSVHEVTKGLKG